MTEADTTSPRPAPRATTRRWLWVLATVSVAANLLVIGFVAGQFLRDGDRHGRRDGSNRLERIVMRGVADENRNRVRAILDEQLAAVRPLRRERRATRRAVRETLLAQTVDKQAAQTAIAAALTADRKVKEALGNMIVSLSPYISERARRRIVRRLMGGRRRGRRRAR